MDGILKNKELTSSEMKRNVLEIYSIGVLDDVASLYISLNKCFHSRLIFAFAQ